MCTHSSSPSLLSLPLGPAATVFITTTDIPHLASHTGDDPLLVRQTRDDVERAVGAQILWMNQTHSTRIIHHDRRAQKLGDTPTPPSQQRVQSMRGWTGESRSNAGRPDPSLPEWDADRAGDCVAQGDGLIISCHPAPVADQCMVAAPDQRRRPPAVTGAAVLTADCVPILIASHDGSHIAAVHAGRQGAFGHIAHRAMTMMASLTDQPLHVMLGPSICGPCYEVDPATFNQFTERYPRSAQITPQGTASIDVAAAVTQQCSEEVERSGGTLTDLRMCTFSDERFYSYRRDHTTQRIASIVVPRFA